MASSESHCVRRITERRGCSRIQPFLHQHFGFAGVMAADGFASVARRDIGMNVVYLRRGLPALPGDQRDVHATGLIPCAPWKAWKANSPGYRPKACRL